LDLNKLKKFAYVSIYGSPNAGKSTLVNLIVGHKCSIVSPRPHTTNQNVMGVVNTNNTQIAFIDTPGISFKKGCPTILENEADVVCILIDASKGNFGLDHKVVKSISGLMSLRNSHSLSIVFNKVDLVRKYEILKNIQEFSEYTKDIFLVSAKKGSGVEDFVKYLENISPEGDWRFNNYTDKDMKFFIEEEVREKLLLNTYKEIPFTSSVKLENVIENDGIKEFYINIFVAKDNHKGIILGKGGSMIKKIGESSRREIQSNFNIKARLFLNVTVKSA
jgi:GTPase